MPKQLNVDMLIKADTSQARKEMKALQESLSKLGTGLTSKTGITGITSEIQKASQEVAQLKVQLKEATNVDTGKLDWTKFEQSMKKSGASLSTYRKSLQALGPEGTQAFTQLARAVANSEIPVLRISNLFKQLGTTLKNTVKWQISSTAIHAFMGAVQGAYGYAQDLNESLNNIRIVTGQSAEQMSKFAIEANKAAQALGTTTTQYTDAALIYYQQGIRNQQEIEERVNTTIKLANVTKASADEVSSQLTAIWNNFYDGSESLEVYADKITALGAATASSSAEIAEGLSKFASVADTVGLSYDYATAALATVVAQTRQSADVVGTAFKTLFGRLEGLKLGDTLEDGVDLNKYSKALSAVGVDILDNNKQLKNMDTILDELGAKWQTIGKEEKIALAQTVGGVRQYTQLIALMENYDTFKDNLNVAKNAEGALQEQQKIYEESWEAASKKVKAAWEEVVQDLLDDKTFIDITNGLAKVINVIDRIIENMGGLKGLLTQIAPLLANLYSDQLVNGLQSMALNLQLMLPGGRDKIQRARDTQLETELNAAMESTKSGMSIAQQKELKEEIELEKARVKASEDLNEHQKSTLDMIYEQLKAQKELLKVQKQEVEEAKKQDELEVKKASAMLSQNKYSSTMTIGYKGHATEQDITNQAAEVYQANYDYGVLSNINGTGAAYQKNGELDQETAQIILNQLNGVKAASETALEGIDTDKVTQELQKFIEDGLINDELKNSLTILFSNISNRVKELGETAEDPQALGKKLYGTESSIFSGGKNAKGFENSGLTQAYDELGKSSGNLTQALQRYSNNIKDAGEDQEKVNKAYQDLKGTVDKIIKNNNLSEEATKELNDALKREADRLNGANEANKQGQSIAENAQSTGQAASSTGTMDAQVKDAPETLKKAGAALKEVEISTQNWADKAVAVSRGFLTVNAVINSTKNLINTLGDETATLGEKIGAVFQWAATNALQLGMLMKSNIGVTLKNILFTDKSTKANTLNAASADAEAAANKRASMSGVEKAGAEKLDAAETNKSTLANTLKSKFSGANTKLFGEGQNIGTAIKGTFTGGTKGVAVTQIGTGFGKAAGAQTAAAGGGGAATSAMGGLAGALGPAAAILIGLYLGAKTFVGILDLMDNGMQEANKKMQAQNEENKKWLEDNKEGLEAAHSYDILNKQLKNNIITTEEYNKSLAETAKQMNIANAELLEQAGAYNLLEAKVKQESERLEAEESSKALQTDYNARNLMNASQTYSQAAADMFVHGSWDANNLTSSTLTLRRGASLESGEEALLKELKALNIAGVNISDKGEVSWDKNTMKTSDLAQLSEFFASVQANPDKYGGKSNELIDSINELNEDWSSLAEDFKKSTEIENRGEIEWYLENSDIAKKALDSGEQGYSTLLKVLGDQFGEETARAVLSGQFDEAEILKGETLKTFAEVNKLNLGELNAGLKEFEKQGGNVDDAMTAMTSNSEILAAALRLSGGSFEDLGDIIQSTIDSIDLSSLGDQLASLQKLINSLNFGDLIDEKQYDQLVKQFGEELVSQYVAVLPNGEQRIINDPSELMEQSVNKTIDLIESSRGEQGKKRQEELKDLQEQWLDQNGSIKNIQEKSEQAQLNKDVNEAYQKVDSSRTFKTLEELDEQMKGLGQSQEDIDRLRQSGNLMTATKTNSKGEATEWGFQKDVNLEDADPEVYNQILEDYSAINEELKEYQELEKNPFALEDKIVNSQTTMERLQDYLEKGYISNEKYQESIGAAAAASAEALDLDKKALIEQAKYLEENNAYVKDNYEEAMQLALAYQRQSSALTDLASNYDTYEDKLKNSEKGSKEYSEAMESLEKDMQNLFNTDDTVGEDFILEHLKDIKKAADNDIKAVKRLQEAYAMDILSQDGDFTQKQIDTVQGYIDSIKWEDLEIGMGVDTQPALQDLWNFYEQALKDNKITAEQMQNTWNALGYELTPIYERKWTPYMPGDPNFPGGEYQDYLVGFEAPKYSGNAKASTSSKKSSNKGKSSRSKKDKKDYEDEFERYYTINRQIQDQEDLIERLGKAKDRAYGRAKIQNIEKEKKALEGQYDLEKKKLKEIQDYYKKDQQALNFFGAKYDENGVVTNYDEMIKREVAAYNKAVDKYNKGGSEKDFNKASERYEDFKEKLKQYDDTNELYQDQLEKIQDLQNEIFDKDLEVIEYQVQVDIEVDDDKLNYLEYQLDRIQKKAFSTGEALSNMVSQLYVNIDKANVNRNALEETLGIYGLDLDSIDSLSDKQISKLGLTEQTVEDLRNYRDQLLEAQKAIDELEESILNGPLESMKEWNEEFDYQEDKIANNINLLKQYQNISELIYESAPGVDDQYIYNLMESQYKQGVNGIEAAHTELEANKRALQEARQSYEQAIAEGMNEQNLNTLKQNLREMEDQVAKSENDMLKLTEENLKRAQDLLKKFVDTAAEKLKKALGASDWDMTQFDRLKELDDQYLDDYEKIYEFSKLTRDINNSIDDADTIRQKERLREITQEIADIEASGKEVSQYEIDALRKKYELRLAEIALEDAQAAKSTVRMSRDNDGNWSYVYTADNDNVDKARQNYEDKLYEYQKLNSEFIKEQEGNFLKLEQEYVDAMTKIAEDSSLNQEDKEMRLQETQAYYQRMAEIMSDQLGIALDKNSELYAKDWLDYSKTTGYKISKMEDYQTKIDDTYIGHLQPTIESSTDLLNQFMEYTVGDDGFYSQLGNALDDYYQKQDETLQAAGTSLAGYAGDVTEAMEAAEDSSKDAADSVTTSAQEMRDAFDEVIDKVNDLNKMNLDQLRKDNDKTIKSIGDLIEKYKDLGKQIDKTNSKANNSGSTGGNYSGGSGSGSGGGGGGGNTTTTKNYSKDDANLLQWVKVIQSYIYTKGASGYILPGLSVNPLLKAVGYKENDTGRYNFLMAKTNSLVATIKKDKTAISKLKAVAEAYKKQTGSSAKIAFYDTGGYTGSWGTEGKLAMLHQKELVLNAKDTENMLNTVQMVRDIVASIDTRAAAAGAVNIGSDYANNVSTGSSDLNQNVHIEASFPNATDHNEIELALTNLVNRASQYAGRKTL